MYEAWPASLSIEDRSGRRLASGINLLFDVQDANRYFYPEATKRLRGYNNPEAGLNVGFSMDLCYDRSLPGRQSRGGICDWATNYGQLSIKWNDPRSGFRGLNRGMYFQPAVLNNAGGSEFVYTDPYGKNAQSTPFTGSVRQQISTKNVDYGRDIIQDAIDPRVIMRTHDDGGRTVHAPN